MVIWFVGQRVKVVKAIGGLRPDCNALGAQVGDIGFVAGTQSQPNRGFWADGRDVISVKIDRFNDPGIGLTECFEPILPEGAQPLGYSFEQMMGEFGVTEAVK